VVGQREEAVLAMFGVGLRALAAQYPPGAARLAVLDASPPEGEARRFLARMAAGCGQAVEFHGPNEIAALFDSLAGELAARADHEAAPGTATFVFIRDLQKFKRLRKEDDFSFSMDDDAKADPAKQFNDLLAEGAAAGIHLVVSVDTYNNVGRWINRKALTEFEMRVLFQMSANDSANLIDSPAAANLGLHRALYYNEHEGVLETFRPYALPAPTW
jgi:DNA segregation ATPase FtsK/SpoIIIE, S-DNA-T family